MEPKKPPKKTSIRHENIKSLLLGVSILLVLNIIGSYFFYRFDFTSEKRFTLKPATKQLIKGLDDFVHIKIYLEGDFPAGFKRLRNSTREMLDELRAYTPNISYEFINPTIKGDRERTEEIYTMLVRSGLQPTQLQVQSEDASSQQIIFSGGIVSYRGREIPFSLLQEQMGMSSENVINNSIQSLEYNLASVIHKTTLERKPRIAFLEGNGEFEFRDVASVSLQLREFYDAERLKIDGNAKALDGISTIVVAQPLEQFSENDKFIIDQFIMQGGSVLWLLDPVFASMDSLQRAPETLGMAWPVNLDDMLFRYGIRLNADLIMDMQATPIPITTGFMGDRPQISLMPWFYFPLVNPASDHPIVRNLNAIRTEFISTIDTVAAEGIRKTFLLRTSPYTRVVQTPARISFDILQTRVDETQYRSGHKPVAVLLEGEFTSVFTNRRSPIGNLPEGFQRRNKGLPTAMIVVSDGDIIRNQFDNRGQPLPLGYDRFIDQQFGNDDFILNAINYLNDDMGLMEARTREIRLRLLDKNRVNDAAVTIKIFNVALPLILLLTFGFIRFYLRKRKYGQIRLIQKT